MTARTTARFPSTRAMLVCTAKPSWTWATSRTKMVRFPTFRTGTSLSAPMTSGLAFRLIRNSVSPIFALPVGNVRFCAEIARATSWGARPSSRRAARSRSTEICRDFPPIGKGNRVPRTTLSIVRTRWFTWSKISDSLSESELNAIWMTGTLEAE